MHDKKRKSKCHGGPGYDCKCKSKTNIRRKAKSKTEKLKP